jgi:hypothetical protein
MICPLTIDIAAANGIAAAPNNGGKTTNASVPKIKLSIGRLIALLIKTRIH